LTEKLVKRAGSYRFLLYVPEQDEDLVQEWIKKCQSQGVSASSVLIEFIRSQSPMVESGPEVCDLCQKSSSRMFVARFVSGQKLNACPSCFKEKYDKGLVRVVLKGPREVGESKSEFNPNLFGSQGRQKP
jgi:hypothetical protein